MSSVVVQPVFTNSFLLQTEHDLQLGRGSAFLQSIEQLIVVSFKQLDFSVDNAHFLHSRHILSL